MARPTISVLLMIVMATGCTAIPGDPSGKPSQAIQAESAKRSAAATPAPSAPMTPRPMPSPEALPADLDPDLVQAIKLRRDYGLRSDLAYVRMVANDPRASNDAFGVPVYPEEFTEAVDRNARAQEVALIVRGYADTHLDEFGGLYLDLATHTDVVSLWTDHLSEHAATIRAKTGPGPTLAFGQVRYSEVELRRLQDLITAQWRAPWIAAIPAVMEGVGVETLENMVVVEVSSANPDAAAIIAAHFDVGDRMRVESDGTGVRLIPWGTVKGRVTPLDGIDLGETALAWTSTDSGECGGGDMGFGVTRDGTFELPCQVGTWTIKLVHVGNDGIDGELGHGTVKVSAGKTSWVTIHLQAGS